MPRYGIMVALLLGWLVVPGCELGLPAGTEPHRELNFINMGDQPKLKPQRGDIFGERPTGMMAPPAGAVAVDEHPYHYTQAQGDEAGAELKNPLQPTPEVLAKGKWVFENICIVCHGPKGAGDGHLTKLFPKPPSLMTQKVRDWSDGRIFHLPMRGQGSMPSHSTQLESYEIWSVIHHIRALQKSQPVAPPPPKAAPTKGAPATPALPRPATRPATQPAGAATQPAETKGGPQ